MRLRVFLLSSAITVGGLAGFAPASADCYGPVNACGDNGKCAADAIGNWATANDCTNASECDGTVNYCPNANGNSCHGDVNVCGKPPVTAGFTCRFATVTDPQNQGNQAGEVDSHFATFSTSPTANPAHGHIACRFQTGPSYTHQGTVLASVTSPEQNTIVDLTSTVSYPEPTSDVYICTEWYAGDSTVSAPDDTRYLSDDSTGELHGPGEVTGNETCALATSQDTGPVAQALDPAFALLCGLVAGLPEPVASTLGGLLC
jgi:hypothetical protein